MSYVDDIRNIDQNKNLNAHIACMCSIENLFDDKRYINEPVQIYNTLFFPLLCGSIIGLIISNYIQYADFIKPPLAPPGFIFPIVWSILYILMGIAFYLYKNNSQNDKKINILYYIQLTLNLLWSIFFFILKWRLFTVIYTIIFTIIVIILLIQFYTKYKPAFYLNIPYLLWLLFATYLTIGIYILN